MVLGPRLRPVSFCVRRGLFRTQVAFSPMPYRRAFSTLGCPDFTLDQALALAAQHLLDGVELRALGGTVELPTWLERTYGSPEKLQAALGHTAAKILAFDTGLRLDRGGIPAEREAFLQFVPWAEALGVRWLRIFDGGTNADDAEIAQAVETLRWWRERRARHGWRADLMVETHDSLITTAAIQRLLAVAPDTAILWDSHHTWKKGGEDPLATWRALRPHIVHIHVKDSTSQPSANHPFTYVPPGQGEFPMAALAAALRAEFTGTVSLEWEKLWHPYLAPLDTALASAARHGWW
jgi:sugar phosphate isomerase/epimerase